MTIKDREGVEFGSALDTLGWLVDVKGRDEHREALREINDALNDSSRRHDRALDAEARERALAAEVRRLHAKLARVEAAAEECISSFRLWTSQEMYGEYIRDGMTPSDFEAWDESISALSSALKDPP